MLIEHPEDGIHAGLTKKIMGLLRDYADPLQLFISSHSLTVFNTLSLEDVRLVTMVDGETKVRGLTEIEIEAARKYISEEGDMADVIQSLEE
jgi:predicted ATPase